MKKKNLQVLKNVLMIIVGSAMFALGFDLFLEPCGINCGGVSGIAMLIVYAVDVSIRNIPYLCVVGIFRAGGDTRTGLIGDVSVQYFLVLPTVILCGLVLKLPFFWTFVISLIVDDAGKLAVYLPRFLSMKWIQPVTTRQ